MKYLTIYFCLLLSFQVFAQNDMEPEPFIPATDTTEKTDIEENTTILEEEMPEFIGGERAMLEFLYANIEYPPIARENGIEGLVVVSFIVNEDGSLSDFQIRRDIGGGCGEEAVRVMKTMPTWKPGKQDGKAVRVSYNMPVRFKLEGKKKKKKRSIFNP